MCTRTATQRCDATAQTRRFSSLWRMCVPSTSGKRGGSVEIQTALLAVFCVLSRDAGIPYCCSPILRLCFALCGAPGLRMRSFFCRGLFGALSNSRVPRDASCVVSFFVMNRACHYRIHLYVMLLSSDTTTSRVPCRLSHHHPCPAQVVLEANTSLLKRSGNCLNELQNNFEAEMEEFERVRTRRNLTSARLVG